MIRLLRAIGGKIVWAWRQYWAAVKAPPCCDDMMSWQGCDCPWVPYDQRKRRPAGEDADV